MHTVTNNQPRYLHVAHWLLAQKRWMTARQVAVIFDVTPKLMCGDFAVLRQRKDLFTLEERAQKCRNGYERLIRVIDIHPYRLDERQCSHPTQLEPTRSNDMTCYITWHDLVSKPWHRLAG